MLKGWTITKRSFYSTFKHNRWYINSRNQFRSCSATLLSRVGWNMFFLRICCKLGQRRGSHISICKKTWIFFLNFVLLQYVGHLNKSYFQRITKCFLVSKLYKSLNFKDNSTNKNPMRIVASICLLTLINGLNA